MLMPAVVGQEGMTISLQLFVSGFGPDPPSDVLIFPIPKFCLCLTGVLQLIDQVSETEPTKTIPKIVNGDWHDAMSKKNN